MTSPRTFFQSLISFCIAVVAVTLAGCSTVRSIFALDNAEQKENPPISNPFGEYYDEASAGAKGNMIFRTRRGDRSVEVEIPQSSAGMSDLTIPVNPSLGARGGQRSPASIYSSAYIGGSDEYAGNSQAVGEVDESYRDTRTTSSDREIASHQPTAAPEDEGRRGQIEQGLGLRPSEGDAGDDKSPSYLAKTDRIRQLYKLGRYEAGLIEVDQLLAHYQTDPKLYEMRGTLLDRMGRSDLALRSWNQALRFEPGNKRLRKYLERRMPASTLAAPKAAPAPQSPSVTAGAPQP